jgi:hypothetical protein
MGHYTRFSFKAKLKKDTPTDVIAFLKKVIVDGDIGMGDACMYSVHEVPKPEISHPFFDCPRWHCLLTMNNGEPISSKFSESNGVWTLGIESDFKHYNDEIDNFINWISPYIPGHSTKKYVGWYMGEWTHDPTHIHINQQL